MTEAEARAGVPGQWRVRHFDEVTSTNSMLLEAGRSGEAPGLVYVADLQTKGRGRLDRSWQAGRGDALLISVLLGPEAAIAELATRAMALAVADVCAARGVIVQLKWPNDVLVGGRKLAGILGEAASAGGDLEAVVVGCGLNVAAVPPEMREASTCLNDHLAEPLRPGDLIAALLDSLRSQLSGDVPGTFARRCSTVGHRVRVATPSGFVEGLATGIDPSGALMIDTGDGAIRVSVGDASSTRTV